MNPEVKLPSKEELTLLPRWARVAFAARCARRVLPLFTKGWPDAPNGHVVAVRQAVEFAEQAGNTRSDVSSGYHLLHAAGAAHAAEAAHARAAVDAARAAVAAARAAVDTAVLASRAAAVLAARAADDANDAAASSEAHGRHAVLKTVAAIRADYDRLMRLVRTEAWDHTTPVSPERFGPLWPHGEPDWTVDDSPQPAAGSPIDVTDREFRLIIRAVADEGVSADTVRHHLIELYKALNEFTLAKYGCYLTREGFRRLIFQETGVRV